MALYTLSAVCSILSFISLLYFLMSSVTTIMIAVVRLYTIKKGITSKSEFSKVVKVVCITLWLNYIAMVTVLTLNGDRNISRLCIMFLSQYNDVRRISTLVLIMVHFASTYSYSNRLICIIFLDNW